MQLSVAVPIAVCPEFAEEGKVAVTVIGVLDECMQVARPKLSVRGLPTMVFPMLAFVVSETDHVTLVRFDCMYAQLLEEACPTKAENCCEFPGAARL